MSNTQLAFSVITEQYDKSIFDLGQIFSQVSCSLDDFYIRHLADSVVAGGLVSGAWQKIARLEMLLATYVEKSTAEIKIWRPTTHITHHGFPYVVEASFPKDDGKAIAELFLLFEDLNIKIISGEYSCIELDAETTMVKALFNIKLPGNEAIQGLRECFYHFCSTFNVDGCIELCRR